MFWGVWGVYSFRPALGTEYSLSLLLLNCLKNT
nr:MAG TPA: hypothetical protein [Caudoviricetes sp.]DAX18502.1 MAG TPA: hypothetical protein [Caudoviricetes sp.]